MDPDRWRRVKRLFQAASERPPAEREEWLEEACGGDAGIEREVRALLESHESAGDFLAQPSAAIALAAPEAGDEGAEAAASSLEGRRLGRYRIVRRVGAGGIGAVYLAVREDDFTKQVAVKVIRHGMATREVLARFRGERQILAAIEHPNIARLVDGGATPDGLPYLVMEYIEGLPIDLYCDSHRLDVRRRLELFAGVCEAVQVAHRHLVIHRDIKPGNILVTTDGVPKLLDFGIAKILDPALADGLAPATRLGHRVLTPEFASPEQLRGERVTTSSDVYSLGSLLYLLLCGRTPHDLAGLPLAEVARRVAERQPRRPSAAVTSGENPAEVAAARATAPAQLARALRGDLDNIVLEALRREPERRYPSPERLAADVRRHLADLPVTARPDTLGYRAGKFVRRHRAAVVSAALAAAATLTLLVSVSLQSVRLARERAAAERAAARATAVGEFLQGVLATADPSHGLAHDARVVDALDRATARIGGAFPDAPEVEAAVRHGVGSTYLRLGRFAEAEPQLTTALELRRAVPAESVEPLVESLIGVGALRHEQGRYEEAEALYREALAVARASLPALHAATAGALGRLATVRHDLGDDGEAATFYRRSLDMRRSLYGGDHPEVATALDDLANLHHDRGDLDTAEAMYREALKIRRDRLGPAHPDLSGSLNNVGAVLHDRGRLEDAEAFYRESLAMARSLFGDEHPDVASGLNNLAAALRDQQKLAPAERLYRESFEMTRRLFGVEHERTADAAHNLALLLDERDEDAEAETLYLQAISIAGAARGPGSSAVAVVREDLAEQLAERGRSGEAEALLRRSVADGRDAEVGDRDLAIRLLVLADRLNEEGRAAEAAEILAEAVSRADAAAVEPDLAAEVRLELARALAALGRVAEARTRLGEARERLEAEGGDDELLREVGERLAALAVGAE